MTTARLASLTFIAIRLLGAQTGIKDFQKIDDNVYRGRQPGADGFAALANMGIKTVIDLRGGVFHGPREKKIVEQAGMRYVKEQFSGVFPPTDKQIAKLLIVMQDPNATPVFVHCKRGADRSGVLIACYRMVHDHWSNRQAFTEARAARFSPLEVLMHHYINHFDANRLPHD